MVDGQYVDEFRERERLAGDTEQQAITVAAIELSRELELDHPLQISEVQLREDLMPAATLLAHNRLASSVLGGESVGYQTARQASSWLHYTEAVLKDLARTEPIGRKWLEQLRREHEYAAIQLRDSNPFFFGSFARLTDLRLELEEADLNLTNPFGLEAAVVLRVFMNTAKAAKRDRGNDTASSSPSTHLSSRGHRRQISINREPDLGTPVYVISEHETLLTETVEVAFVPATEDEVPISSEGHILPVRSLTVVETPQGVSADLTSSLDPGDIATIKTLEAKYNLPRLGTSGVLGVAQALEPRPDDTVFELPSTDLPELGRLAEAA